MIHRRVLARHLAAAHVALLVTVSFAASASAASLEWFSDVSIAIRAGGGFIENATSDGYEVGFAPGFQLDVSALKIDWHRITFAVSYTHPGIELRAGTEQVEVQTVYTGLIGATAGYLFKWKALLAGAKLGAGFQLIQTTTRIYDLSYAVSGEELVFEQAGIRDVDNASGNDSGLFLEAEIGFDMGYMLGLERAGIEVKAQTDFFRRGQREEFYLLGAIAWRPYFQ